jgi:peptide deformylase
VAFDAHLKKLTDDMFETMVAYEGVGLAAPQIGLSLQLFVMDCEGLRLIAANPRVIATSGLQKGEEGCLSLGRIHHVVDRPKTVTLRAQGLLGEFFEIEAHDLAARCVMHETDHCEGELFLVHLSPLQRDILIRKFKKAQKKRDEDNATSKLV